MHLLGSRHRALPGSAFHLALIPPSAGAFGGLAKVAWSPNTRTLFSTAGGKNGPKGKTPQAQPVKRGQGVPAISKTQRRGPSPLNYLGLL